MNGWHKIIWPDGQVEIRFFLDGVSYLCNPADLETTNGTIDYKVEPICRGPIAQYPETEPLLLT